MLMLYPLEFSSLKYWNQTRTKFIFSLSKLVQPKLGPYYTTLYPQLLLMRSILIHACECWKAGSVKTVSTLCKYYVSHVRWVFVDKSSWIYSRSVALAFNRIEYLHSSCPLVRWLRTSVFEYSAKNVAAFETSSHNIEDSLHSLKSRRLMRVLVFV